MKCHAITHATAHQPWPLPDRPWVMVQIWHDRLFAARPTPPEVVRQRVPSELPLDIFAGQAWLVSAAHLQENTMAAAAGLTLPGAKPLLASNQLARNRAFCCDLRQS